MRVIWTKLVLSKGVLDMRRTRKIFWAGSLAVLLALSAVAAAKAQNPKRLQQAGLVAGIRGMFLQGLDLTDQQKEQIRTILTNHKSDIQSVAQESLKAQKGLREALAAGADDATLKYAYDKVSAAGWDALLLRKNIGAEIKPVLTPEQLAKLQKRLANMGKFAQKQLAKRSVGKHVV
jgi:periplasmic protein CpxP/Spy